MAEGRVGRVWNYPTLIPLLCHYFPGRFGYEATQERLAAIETRLQRLEEYLYYVAKAIMGDDVRKNIEKLRESSGRIASIVTLEEEIMAYPPNTLALYVNGISDVRALMPMVKVDKSKLPKFTVPVWTETREEMIAQAHELGLPLPKKELA